MAARRQIDAHTGLRGVAAMLVVAFHLQQIGATDVFPLEGLNPFFSRFYIFVDLFFILSGFVISYAAGAERRSPFDWRQGRRFLLQRLIRVYPLHLFCLGYLVAFACLRWGVLAALGRAGDNALTAADLISLGVQALLLNAWIATAGDSWNLPSWSISAEIFAYVMFLPLVGLWTVTRRGAYILLAAIPLAFYIHIAGEGGSLNAITPLRALAGFCLGMLGYYLRDHAARPSDRVLSVVQIVAGGGVIAAIGPLRLDLLAIPSFFVLILATWTDRGIVARVLSVRPMRALGVISYSIYLNHTPLVAIVASGLRNIGRWSGVSPTTERLIFVVLIYAVTIGISTLTYFFVEKRARRALMARLEAGPPDMPAAEPAAP